MGPDLEHGVWWILLVAFLTTGSTNAQNTADCGGELTQQSGVVTSPGYPDNYPNSQRCAWTVSAYQKKIIDLRFSRLDLEGVENTAYWWYGIDTCPDYVKVYDGDSDSAPLLATMCRIKNQTELAKIFIRSTSNVLYMVFVSDYQGQRPGFVASYWAHECSEFTYGQETCNNTCTCIKEHTAYCNNTSGECICKKEWTSSDCSQDVNECVNPKVEPCPFDYTECANNQGSFDCVCKAGLVKNANGECEVKSDALCDQGNSCSHLCVKISGQDQCYCPDNMKLVGNTCQACSNVAFGKDCRLSCNCIQNNTKSCDIITGGCICSEGWTSSNCSQDIDECTQLLGSVCPSSSERCVNTLGGYQCNCTSGGTRSPSGSCGCSYTLTDSSGVVQSNGYPNYIYADVLCNWTIIASYSGMTISFSMSEIYVGYSYDAYQDVCYYGSLEVYDGSNSSYPLLGRYCGSYTNTGIIRSSGSTMFIAYTSQYSSSHFSGTYSTSVYQVIRSTITDPAGIITSPGFPVSYSYNVTYTWTITVADKHVVVFSFSDFGLGECGKDFVNIYDGKHAGALPIAQFCGSSLPRTVSSTKTSMHIIYSSEGSTSEKGFNGSYVSDGCKYTLTDSSGVIQSRGYPNYNAYSNVLLCNWTIIASDSGMTISFSMSETHVGYNYDAYREACYSGSLEVYDGPNSSYPLLGRYCGYYTNTSIIRSSGSTMFIAYNVQYGSSRFTGTYSTSDYQVFRSTTTDPAGIITSPGFPASYSYNVAYTWTITVANEHVVTISFSDFELGECGKDFVEIYDGKHPGALPIGNFCGSSLPKTVSSTNRSMHIIYSSVGSTSEKGFNGSYIADACWCSPYYTSSCKSPTGPCVCVSGMGGSYCDKDIDECLENYCPAHSSCINSHMSFTCTCWNGTQVNANGSCDDWNKKLSGPTGDIESQDFPNRYPPYVNYTWLIPGKGKEVVTFRFSQFDVEPWDKCYKDSVMVYDGVGSTSKLIGQYCGKNIPALLRSTKPEMRIRFLTDSFDYGLYKGFKGTYYVHECPLFTYGEEKCTKPCSCAFDTTRVCDNTNGVCFCKPGWVGSGCSQDLDECRNPTVCPKNSECFNEPGSFSCECNSGYVKDPSGQCIESSRCSDAMKQKCSHLCDVDYLTNEERCFCPQDFALLNDDVTCVVSLYPHGYFAADNSPIVRTNDKAQYVDNNIVFSSLVPLGKGFQNNARILYNGAITFNRPYLINFPNLEEALANRYSLLAPFWTENRNIGIGDIFYHVYETCGSSIFMDPGSSNTSFPKEQQVLARAIRDIKQFYNLPDFKVSVVFVVTWKNVITKGCDDIMTNTFQAILVSGYNTTTQESYLQVEERSYVIFIYNNGSGICKPKQPFDVGIVTESGVIPLAVNKDNPQLTQMIGNTGYKGVITFPVGKKHSESIMCQRYLCEHAYLVANKYFRAEIDALYQCPCSLDKLGLQWQLLIDAVDRKCYSISAVAKRRLLGTNQRNRVIVLSF